MIVALHLKYVTPLLFFVFVFPIENRPDVIFGIGSVGPVWTPLQASERRVVLSTPAPHPLEISSLTGPLTP